jgi:hypothetical protein
MVMRALSAKRATSVIRPGSISSKKLPLKPVSKIRNYEADHVFSENWSHFAGLALAI